MKARRALQAFVTRLDLGLLLVPLLGLVAAWPFLTQSLPSTDDGALHMLRLAEIDRSLRHGVLPLRWAPDFAHGYGYPFFNFYASLSSYIAEIWRLLGLSIPQSVAAATVLALWVSGWGAYLLGRDIAARLATDRVDSPRVGSPRGGRLAGLVVATAYMYAPYQFYDSAYRGNLAETWALALVPWVLWTARRAALRPVPPASARPVPPASARPVSQASARPVSQASARPVSQASARRWCTVVPLALCYAALIYTHNVYALISSPVLGLYLLLLWWTEGHSWLEAMRLVSGLVLGLALSAFFWLPAFGERGWTRFSTGLVDYRTFFLSLRELLALPPQVDLSLLNYYPPRSLSWGMLALILAGLVLLVVYAWQRVRTSADSDLRRVWKPALHEVGFFFVVFLGAAFLTIRASDLLWRTVPLLGYALIPWRFLGIASLAGSVVAGMAITGLPDRPTWRSPALIVACAAIALLVATALPWTYAQPVSQRAEIGVAQIVGWEYSSKLIGTTAKNEFLPIWSPRLPPDPADPALLDKASSEQDPIIARLDESSLPEGAKVVSAEYGLMRAELEIDTPQAFRALYKQLYFPGWRVTVDGHVVTPIAAEPYGLLGFDVPAGKHRIVIRPAPTPLRLAGNIVTGLGLVIVVACVVFGLSRRTFPEAVPNQVGERPSKGAVRSRPGPQDPSFREGQLAPSLPQVDNGSEVSYNLPRQRSSAGSQDGLPRSHWIAIALLALALLVVKEGWIDRTENLFRARRFDPESGGNAIGVQHETALCFGDAFTLLGYDLARQRVVAGEPLRVDLYLSARQPPGARGAGEGDYMAYARLVDEEGRLWGLPDSGMPEGHRPPPGTSIWPTDAYAHWATLAHTLPGTPPGRYWIQVGLFERETWRGLNVYDEAGQLVGLSTRLGPVEIVRPRTPPTLDELDIECPADAGLVEAGLVEAGLAEVGPELRFLGTSVDAAPNYAGDVLDLTLFWQATRSPMADYGLRLVWRSGEETLSLGDNLPLGRRDYPTSAWTEGEIVRSPHRLRAPANAPHGTYTVEATVVDERGQLVAPPIVVTKGVLKPTDRLMAVPDDIQQQADANLDGQVTLLGYDLPARDAPSGELHVKPGAALPVTLYWQAQHELPVSYKVFVQLVGPEGVVAQVDTIPAGWQRPTTGWVPGEVIVDEHLLELPPGAPPTSAAPGAYRLITGMYDERTLDRLAVRDASGAKIGDHVVLQEIVLE